MNIFDRADGDLGNEAAAFDSQIDERIRNGHIPDLRRCTPCDYFYNNSWRRPAYVKLDFVEQFEIIRDAILRYAGKEAGGLRVLEVGCGPGYLSLELAREGFDVVGLDLSKQCIEIATEFARQDPWMTQRGRLDYVAGDFYSASELSIASFDVVVFLGALHHFPDQRRTLERARDLLRPDGLIVAHEPVRDRVTRGNAAFAYLVGSLLSASGHFFRDQEIVTDGGRLIAKIDDVYNSLRYESKDGEKIQSVNDNEAGYTEMYPQLHGLFHEELFEWRYAFFHEVIGGLRFDEQTNARLAHFLREMDRILVANGVLQGTEFFFVGRKRGPG